jgi:hypothetical protein
VLVSKQTSFIGSSCNRVEIDIEDRRKNIVAIKALNLVRLQSLENLNN